MQEDASITDETTAGLSSDPAPPKPVRLRTAGTALLVLVVAAAGLDLLGPRDGSTTASGGGYTLAVRYPLIARAGEPAPLDLRITTTGSFEKTVKLRLCNAWFDRHDFQAWYPTPSTETAQPGWIVYEFDPPSAGESLDISLDARVAPGHLGGRDTCDVAVLDGEQPAVSVGFTTWRVP